MKRGGPLRRTGIKRTRSTKNDFPDLVKNLIRIRSEGRCEVGSPICRGEGVVFHHILRRSQRGKGTFENGLHACVPCHTWIHDHVEESLKRGWLAKRPRPDDS